MLFNKNDDTFNERILFKTKPNMFLGCKKAIYGVVLLVIVLIISPRIIQFIGEMQVYLISYINLSLTRYTAIAFFVVILFIIIYIIWQLVGWYAMEYTLTDSRIIIKSGVLSTKKNYMPYATIQDVNTSQSILARIFNVGTVSLFSAYDNNQLELSNISNPSEVENIIFSNMAGFRTFQQSPQKFPNRQNYYDEFEPITPIREKSNYPRKEYEYYPEEITYDNSSHNYEYEPYRESPNNYPEDNYYNQVVDEYSYNEDSYYENNDTELYYNDGEDNFSQNESDDIDGSSEKVIKRHFDKFKK